MKNKLKIFSILLAIFLFGCAAVFSDDIGDIIRYGLKFLPVIILLFFSRNEVLGLWCKFSIAFFFLSALIVLSSSGGSFGSMGAKIMSVYLLSWVFLFLSLILITFKSISLRGK